MPPGVRAGVGLTDALVVLGQRQRRPRWCRRTARAASTPGRAAAPRAGTVPARRRRWRHASRVGPVGTTTPLPASSPSALTTTSKPDSLPPREVRDVDVVEAGERRAGDAELRGEVAGVRLRRLEPGEVGGRSEARDAAGARTRRRSRRRAPPPDRGSRDRRRRPRCRRVRCHDAHVVTVLRGRPRRSPLRVRRYRRPGPASGGPPVADGSREHAFERQLRLGVADRRSGTGP